MNIYRSIQNRNISYRDPLGTRANPGRSSAPKTPWGIILAFITSLLFGAG